MKTMQKLVIFSCLLISGSFITRAQQKPLPPPQDGTFKVLGTKPAAGKVVKGAPYSATATTETVQTLSDGNQIIRRNEAKLYRDSEGRTRLEQSLETIGKWAAAGEPMRMIHLNDPVTGYYYDLDPRTRTAHKGGGAVERMALMKEKLAVLQRYEDWQKEQAPIAKTVKAIAMVEELEKRKQEKLKTAAEPSLSGTKSKDDTDRKKTEALGKQVLEGLEVEGMRVTVTIPAGEVGNTLPIEVVDETWYSPVLQIKVLTKHRDPRAGETTYRLTNITRSEPDRTLFEVPADYTVTENKVPTKPKPAREED